MSRDTTRFAFDPGVDPAVVITSGDTLLVETQDAHSGTITGPDVVYSTADDVVARVGGVNPVTGPIAVQGVKPGDLLEVEIVDIEAAPILGYGYMNTTPTLHPDFEPETTICYRRDDGVELPTRRGPVLVPYRPFVGTLGVAPSDGPLPSFLQRPDVLGNVDIPDLCKGARVRVRANVDGGLLSMGDAHLAQGDAEIHRSAIEAQADVVVRITNLGANGAVYPFLPQINNASEIGSVAPGPGHLEELIRRAYDDLALRLRDDYAFTLPEAYRLLGAVGTVRIGQVVPPVFSALAKIERRYIEEIPDP